ncbi:MAG: shikimate kinase [Proteobacteria bacterium]|nr:shikimate kinase [Pseudomonadota bacterium]MBU1638907.1 shikimate kinase [Pseudomonadota bacterium]
MNTKEKNIILIGYRATGKTSVGKLLARQLGWPFVDSDHAVEKKAAQSIATMVAARGWDFFRSKEKEMLLELTRQPGQVIACGGGAILHQDIWPELKKNAFVVWLKADITTICNRLAGDEATMSQRPSLSGQDIYVEISEILRQRTPLYAAGCHLELDATASLEDIVDMIIRGYQKNR